MRGGRERRLAVGLAGLGLLLAACHLAWAAADLRPPAWDRAIHLESALRAARLLRAGAFGDLLGLSGFYPPLVYWAAGLLHLALGPSPLVALAVIQVALVTVILATYRLGLRILHSPPAAVAAALTVAAYTELFLECRVFMLDLPLTALVALAALAGLRGDGFRHPGWALAFGLLSGLALLVKWTAILFLLPIGVAVAARGRWGRPTDTGGATARGLLLALAALLLVALPWYLAHPGLPLALVSRSVRGTTESVRALDPVGAWTYYVVGVPWQLGPALAAFLVAGLAFARRCRERGLLLAWVLVPIAAFTLLPNKDYRFALPAFPALAVVGVAWIPALPGRWPTRAVALLGIVAAVHGAWLGWGWPAPHLARARMDRRLLLPSFPPLPERWPIAEILDAVLEDRGPGRTRVTLSVVPDSAHLSRPTVSYEAVRRGLPIGVKAAWRGVPLNIDYALTKDGDQGPAHTTRNARLLTDRIAHQDPALAALLTPVGRWALPDGNRALLYRIAPAPVKTLTTAVLESHLRAVLSQSLAHVVRSPEGLWAKVEPLSEPASATGAVRRLVLGADQLEVGDFRGRRTLGVRLRTVEVALDDVQLDPRALTREGRIEILRAGRLTLRRAILAPADLAAALRAAAPWLRDPAVTIDGGHLVVSGRLGPLPVMVALVSRPRGAVAGPLLGLRVSAAALGPLPLPSSLVDRVLGALDLAGRLATGPVPVAMPSLEVAGNAIRVGAGNPGPTGRAPAGGREARRGSEPEAGHGRRQDRGGVDVAGQPVAEVARVLALVDSQLVDAAVDDRRDQVVAVGRPHPRHLVEAHQGQPRRPGLGSGRGPP